MLKRMADWPKKHKIVGDVRGRGLMIGVEIVKDQKTREYGVSERDRIVQLAFERGILFLGWSEHDSHCASAHRYQGRSRRCHGCAGRVDHDR